MSETEKLVTYYSCWYVTFSFKFENYENINILKFENFLFSYFKGSIPHRGCMYLSVNNLCFYAYILGVETTIIIPWTDVVDLGISNSILFPDSIKVVTRDKTEVSKCSYYMINLVLVISISIFPITN